MTDNTDTVDVAYRKETQELFLVLPNGKTISRLSLKDLPEGYSDSKTSATGGSLASFRGIDFAEMGNRIRQAMRRTPTVDPKDDDSQGPSL